MFKSQIPHIDVMKNIQWEKIEQCIVFGCTSLLIQESGSLQCEQAGPQENGGISCNLDPYSPYVI